LDGGLNFHWRKKLANAIWRGTDLAVMSRPQPIGVLAVALLRVYQFLSPVKVALFGPCARCRFTPTCSEYACQCILRHGIGKAIALIVRRILRCNPLSRGGYDPVP
jgi:putative membrane protein insertion efficiency factor